jgi:DNA-binding NarL/FixJ family response regulator
MLAADEFDVLLLDLNLPDRSGLDVLQEAKRLHPRTGVLVLSAYPEAAYGVRAIQMGASGYLNNPAAADELAAAVRAVLAGGVHVTGPLAAKLALAMGRRDEVPPHERLSDRELQVLRLIARGKSTKEIAAELFLSEKTVATYRTRLMDKTGLRSSVEITRYALQNRLVD